MVISQVSICHHHISQSLSALQSPSRVWRPLSSESRLKWGKTTRKTWKEPGGATEKRPSSQAINITDYTDYNHNDSDCQLCVSPWRPGRGQDILRKSSECVKTKKRRKKWISWLGTRSWGDGRTGTLQQRHDCQPDRKRSGNHGKANDVNLTAWLIRKQRKQHVLIFGQLIHCSVKTGNALGELGIS